MNSEIKGISYYLPRNTISNLDLSGRFPEWSVEKITQKIGIEVRHTAQYNETALDMAIKASHNLFLEHKIQPETIDFVILCTQSPDYFLPTSACIIQALLCIPKDAGAFDFNLGCSGYIYGLGIAKGLVETNQAKEVLLITSETYSKFIHPNDKSNLSIFGDAATATLIVRGSSDSMNSFVYGTDGRGANNLIVKNGGMRNKLNGSPDDYLFMNGAEIFSFAIKIVPDLVNQVLSQHNLHISDIDLFIFHQANKFMLETLRKKMSIPEEKFYYFMETIGNTVSSTIPIALSEAIKNKRVVKGEKVMLIGFGVGYSWGGCIITV